MVIDALDVLYVPSRDVEADVRFYRDTLGGRVVFAIEAMGTRVAEIALAPQGPRLLLADHLSGDAPVLLHRVSDLDQTLAELAMRGLRLDAHVAAQSHHGVVASWSPTRPLACRLLQPGRRCQS